MYTDIFFTLLHRGVSRHTADIYQYCKHVVLLVIFQLATNMAKVGGLNSSLRLLATAQAAKLGTWHVRIITPFVEEWDMTSNKKIETIHARKFVARLVGQDPEEYCLGIVPFDFQDHKAADKAKLQFLPGSVWKLEDVCLVTSNDLKFLGCTVNVIVDLKKSKTTKRLRRHSIYIFDV